VSINDAGDISMLMHVISLNLYKALNVIVHNQHLDIKLLSPVYFCNHGTYHEYPVKRTDDGVMMKTGFRFDPEKDKPSGMLMYQVKRKGNAVFSLQPSIDTIYTDIIKETSKMMRLLVTWRCKHFEEPEVRIVLVEYDDESILNEDKLAQLYDKIDTMLPNHYRCTWLVDDNAALKAAYKAVQKEDLELKITISKELEYLSSTKPMWVDPERQVPFLTILYSVLICVISLNIQLIMNVTIKNECPNIKLTSPVHFVRDTTCHIQLSQQVNPKSTMKTKFITCVDQNTPRGALLYHLQKEDVLIDAQLLMIWGYNPNGLYSDVWLIDHESAFVWNEDKLKRLYDAYNIQGNIHYGVNHCLLNDNTKLEVVCKPSYGSFEIEVTISEYEHLSYPIKPLYIDPNR
jgi:hypothetical protein